jgi:hypothetical protein
LRVGLEPSCIDAFDVGDNAGLREALEVELVNFYHNLWLVLVLFVQTLEPLLQVSKVGGGLGLKQQVYFLLIGC